MNRGPRKFTIGLVYLVAIVCISIVGFEIFSFHFQRDEVSKGGTLSLTELSPTSNELVPLSGDWTFYPNQLLTPSDLANSVDKRVSETIKVPQIWGTGFGTYTLHVKLNPSEEKLFNAIEIPSISSAYRFWINGSLVRTAGEIGTNKLTTKAADRPGLALIGSPSNDVTIVVEVSNFVQQKGGIGEPILLGNVNALTRLHDLKLFLQFFIVGSLFIIAIYYASFYVYRRQDRFSLYFALLCLDVGVQTVLLNSSNLVALLPHVSWIFETKAEYLSESLLMILFVLVVQALYKKDTNRLITRFLVTVGVLFSIVFVLTPPSFFTYLITYFSLSASLAMVYAIYVFVKGIIKKRAGAWIQLLSLSFFILSGMNDIFYYLNIIHTGNLLPEGLYIFLLVQNFAASQKHARALSDLERRTQELLRTNSYLESRILDRTKDLERAMAQLKQANNQLTELSTHDTLTTIFNRNYFDMTMPMLWSDLAANSSFVTIMLADIDYFKEYNDTYGHVMGDTCLREVAVSIEQRISTYEGAFIARYGGEEFVIVMPNIHPQVGADIGNHLREEVLQLGIPHEASQATSIVSVSIGLASTSATPSLDWQELIASADRALYAAKRQGRNTVRTQYS